MPKKTKPEPFISGPNKEAIEAMDRKELQNLCIHYWNRLFFLLSAGKIKDGGVLDPLVDFETATEVGIVSYQELIATSLEKLPGIKFNPEYLKTL